jgi:hypothetical protein
MEWEQNVNPDVKLKRLKGYTDMNQRVWFQCEKIENIPPP